jgi:hypothetical protein
VRPLPPLTFTFERALADDLRDWPAHVYAWTWPYPTEQIAQACVDVQKWAEASGHPVDRPSQLTRTIQWWCFEPGSAPAIAGR